MSNEIDQNELFPLSSISTKAMLTKTNHAWTLLRIGDRMAWCTMFAGKRYGNGFTEVTGDQNSLLEAQEKLSFEAERTIAELYQSIGAANK